MSFYSVSFTDIAENVLQIYQAKDYNQEGTYNLENGNYYETAAFKEVLLSRSIMGCESTSCAGWLNITMTNVC